MRCRQGVSFQAPSTRDVAALRLRWLCTEKDHMPGHGPDPVDAAR